MNEQSLQRANAFLAAVASRVAVGELLEATPAEIGRDAGFTEPLAAARAVRALLARKRLQAVEGGYRLLDAKPVEPGEPEAIPRKPRRRKKPTAAQSGDDGTTLTYSGVGHAAIDRLVELGREVGTLRAGSRTAKEESRDAKVRADDAERRANELATRVKDLEAKLEMAEQNLRTLLAAAKGGSQEEHSGEPVGDTEMAAILGILKDKTAED